MRSRRRFTIYLIVVHLVFAVCAVVFLREHRLWLLAVEAFFAVSALVGFRLVRSLFAPLDLIRNGAAQLRDNDFTTRLRPMQQPDLDDLVNVYNTMIDRLREERIRQEEQNAFLERVLAASPAGIVVLDFDRRIAAFNPTAGRLLAGLASGVPLVECGAFGRQLIEMADNKSRVLSLAGSRRVKCERAQFLDRGFQRSFFVLEELTEELRRSEKAAYDKLIRMMAHEVNNTTGAVGSLLAASLGYAPHLPATERGDFTQALEVSITRMQALSTFMRRFADVVRLPSPQRAAVDVGELVQHVAAVLHEDARRRGIAWEWRLQTGTPAIALDRTQMEQALLNILKNALEAIGESGGVVTVRVDHDGRQVVLSVHDTGAGLSDEAREHLFAPFHTTKANGQGLGLTLAREILAAHEFDFELENAAHGGAEFVIRMPAAL